MGLSSHFEVSRTRQHNLDRKRASIFATPLHYSNTPVRLLENAGIRRILSLLRREWSRDFDSRFVLARNGVGSPGPRESRWRNLAFRLIRITGAK
jgi:hypothetical protein